MLAFLMINFFFLDILSGLDSRLLMVLLGCGIALQIFPARSLPGGDLILVVLRSWLMLLLFTHWQLVYRILGMLLVLNTLETVKERGYDLPKRLMFVNVLGCDFWEQPIHKRWRADVFRDAVSSGKSIWGFALWGGFVSVG